METKNEIKSVDVFYSREENSWFADVELVSGDTFNVEGIIPEVKVGKKYVQSNFFVINNVDHELLTALQKFCAREKSELIFISKKEFFLVKKQKENELIYLSNNVMIEYIEISKIEIILKDHYPEGIILTLKTGEQFAIDGRLNFRYIDGTIQYTNVFVIRDGVYPCNENGFGITDRVKLHNEFVNKGFLSEIIEHNGKIEYKLSTSFNQTLTKAICAYNEKSYAMIKIFSHAPEKFSMLTPEITPQFYKPDQPDDIISIYASEGTIS